jgi:hypothetical protein
MPERSPNAGELVKGLETTWKIINDALTSWDIDALTLEVRSSFREKDCILPRQ